MNRTKSNSNVLLFSCLTFSAIIYLIHFLFFRHTFPEINIDEASFFSPAYSFAEKGILSSDLHASFLPGASEYTYWMPPFYMVILGLVFKVFGSSVFLGKLLSFIYSTLAAIVLTFLSRDRQTRLWILALFLICPFVLLSSSFIRMEALALLIVSVSILAVKREVKPGYLGVLGALAIMTHPLLISCAAGLAFVAMRRGVRPVVFFSVMFLLAISPYLFYILKDVELFKEQMALQLIRKSGKAFGSVGISYVLQSISVSAVAIFLLWKIKKQAALKYFLMVGLILALILILKSGEFNYHVYLIPYLIAAIALYRDENLQSSFGGLWIPVSAYCFFGFLLVAKVYKDKLSTDASYLQLLKTLKQNDEWKDKKIYVYGMPDVSIFLMQENQDVERQNAVASTKKDGWEAKYDCIIQVVDHTHIKRIKDDYPWELWQDQASFKTPDGHFTLKAYYKAQQ